MSYNKVKIRRGSGIPNTSDLVTYELGYDYANNKLYIHDGDSGTIVEIGGGSTFAASAITSGTFADARIAASNVTQHTDSKYLRSDANDTASGVITFSNRVTSTGTDGFTIGNYGGYDRIVNNSNVFRFLTDGDAYANMQFATVTAGTWQGTAIASSYIADNSINAAKLNVSGNGSNGQVLKSDGDGTFSWFSLVSSSNASTLDNLDSTQFLRSDATTGTITSQDWNTYIDGTEVHFSQVNNHSGSNRPSGAYGYGLALSYATGSSYAKFQLYAPETGSQGTATNQGLWYRTGWSSNYRQWGQILDSTLTTFTTAANFTAGSINTTGDSQFGNRIAMDGTSPFLRIQESGVTVSYTHLTLPTKRIV